MAQDTDNHSQKKAAAELGASAAAPIKEELKGIMSRVILKGKGRVLSNRSFHAYIYHQYVI